LRPLRPRWSRRSCDTLRARIALRPRCSWRSCLTLGAHVALRPLRPRWSCFALRPLRPRRSRFTRRPRWPRFALRPRRSRGSLGSLRWQRHRSPLVTDASPKSFLGRLAYVSNVSRAGGVADNLGPLLWNASVWAIRTGHEPNLSRFRLVARSKTRHRIGQRGDGVDTRVRGFWYRRVFGRTPHPSEPAHHDCCEQHKLPVRCISHLHD